MPAPTTGSPGEGILDRWGMHLEVGAVVVATVGFVLGARSVDPGSVYRGLDAWQYLGNALSLQTGDGALYHPFRDPLHAALVAKLSGPAGGLREAAEWISLLSVTATIPLVWGLGRVAFGRLVGLLAMVLWVENPDIYLFGGYHGSYALLGAATTAGLGATLLAVHRDLRWTVVAGLAMGLAWATDQRAISWTLVASVGLALSGWRHPAWRRRLGASLGLLVLAGTLGTASGTLAPVPLASLSERVLNQRTKTAISGPAWRPGQLDDGSQTLPCEDP
ncbi:MAG: hypothetical protein QGG40_02290, partial [Myxococcota bacterium]|nr:hypothetical protein [Myxococcota bacterium]